MSRWGRGRGASVAVPLEHLFRENSNCPSAARSAGTVGKWGITSFTSIRTAPYSFGPNTPVQKKPKQDQNSPLTVPAVEPNVAPPKPKKFFKSRNVVPSEDAALPTSSVAPPDAEKAFPSFSKKEEKQTKPISYSKKTPKVDTGDNAAEKLEIPKLKIHVERSPKSNRSKFFATKASKKDETVVEEKTHLSPNKRYLVRNRDKVINYSEDRSNSPPAASADASVNLSTVKVSTPKTSPALSSPTTTYVKPGLLSPTNKDGKPPIVLRISKGTSRLLSTDSEEILTSPNTDRNSFSDPCVDNSTESVVVREAETIASPPTKQESLKITIKCYSGNKEKSFKNKSDRINSKSTDVVTEDIDKESLQTARATRSSRRNQHKEVNDEPVKGASPPPGSDNYELYRTLASPDSEPPHGDSLNDTSLPNTTHSSPNETANDVELSLAVLDSGENLENTVNDIKHPKILSPSAAERDNQSENSTGRAMRHRATINYNENANSFIDDITSSRFNKNPAKSYSRKTKKKSDASQAAVNEVQSMDTSSPDDAETVALESLPVPKISEVANEEASAAAGDVESEVTVVKNNKKTVVQKSSTFEFDDGPIEPDEPSDVVQEKSLKSSDKQLKNNSDRHVFKSPKRLISDGSPVSADNEEKPSVKLVITKKKGSIFKSRSLVNDGPGAAGKKRHLYKHKWADDGKGGQTPRPEPEAGAQVALQEFEESRMLTRVTRYQKDKNPSLEDEIEPYTSVKCPKNAKDYYTVVRNVKKAHQIQEIGEFQEFNDDVEYILDALQDNNPMSTRCLSAITLASKCTAPAFRMHVRAHGTVAKFFRALHDATNDQSLGLCTATVMFVLSQDRLNMDLDRESLELMLNLLESDVSHKDALDDCGLTSAQLAKNKERVRELCAEIKSQGKAKHLDLDNITVGHLAMETLLSLTSKRAGEWFKEELRALGGVDHILSTICDCCTKIGDYVAEWSPTLLDLLRKVDRCMRVLENVSQQNEENQTYLVSWKNGQAVDILVRLFRLCDREIPLYPTCGTGNSAGGAGATIRDALLPTLKVLVNLTHSFRPSSMGSTVVGEQKGIIDASLHLLLQAPNYLPDHNNFEFSVCVLLLLINLMQNNSANIKLLVSAQAPADFESVFYCNKPAIQALIDHFYKREDLARMAEKNTDAILDGEKVKEDEPKDKKNKSHDEFIEETVAKLLQKAGTHMEHTMVGSYIVLLLGHVVMESTENEIKVRNMLPNPTFQDMLTVLKRYFSFLNLTASAEAAIVAHVKATEKIINYLDDCDKKHNAKSEDPSTSDNGATSSVFNNESSPMNSPSEEKSTSFAGYSNMDVSNNSNMSATEFTSESDKMSSSMEMDTGFN
ncbi:cohesin release factor wings apart-like [Arctopsyche grandis]|uniref:cohesin release factor wings apart-like n=1 Tax=Arctopsyche grandis TaxID=121162 RepID=UPI00406D6488